MHENSDFGGVRQAFDDAARWFADTVDGVTADALDAPALGVWSVRDLIGHTLRALTTVEDYLEPASTWVSEATTSDYYSAVTAGRADPDAVAERGRVAGRALGEGVARSVAEAVSRILPIVAAQDATATVVTPVGAWPLETYLPTRVFELVVHTGDLRAALGVPADAPATSGRVALGVLGLLAAEAPDAAAMPLLRALTGRRPLPDGFSLL